MKKYGVKIGIGVVLAAVLCAAIAIWMPYQREQRIHNQIVAHQGLVKGWYTSPGPVAFLPVSIQRNLKVFHRIAGVELKSEITAELAASLSELSYLQLLYLDSPEVTDASLEHLRTFTELRFIQLQGSSTTPAGRAALQRALPNCKIMSDP